MSQSRRHLVDAGSFDHSTATTFHESESLLALIRGEFHESPGLRLTPTEFQRMWNLASYQSESIIHRLIEGRFLRMTVDGTLVRDESSARRA